MYSAALVEVLNCSPMAISDFLGKASIQRIKFLLTLLSFHLSRDGLTQLVEQLSIASTHHSLDNQMHKKIVSRVTSFHTGVYSPLVPSLDLSQVKSEYGEAEERIVPLSKDPYLQDLLNQLSFFKLPYCSSTWGLGFSRPAVVVKQLKAVESNIFMKVHMNSEAEYLFGYSSSELRQISLERDLANFSNMELAALVAPTFMSLINCDDWVHLVSAIVRLFLVKDDPEYLARIRIVDRGGQSMPCYCSIRLNFDSVGNVTEYICALLPESCHSQWQKINPLMPPQAFSTLMMQ
jgi:hypothetical protein